MPRINERRSRRQFQHQLPPADAVGTEQVSKRRYARPPRPPSSYVLRGHVHRGKKPKTAEVGNPIVHRHRVARGGFPWATLRGRVRRTKYRVEPITFTRLHTRVYRGNRPPPAKGQNYRARVPGSGLQDIQIVQRYFHRIHLASRPIPPAGRKGRFHRARVPAPTDPFVVFVSQFLAAIRRVRPPQGNVTRRPVPGQDITPARIVKRSKVAHVALPPGRLLHGHTLRHPTVFFTGFTVPPPLPACSGPPTRIDEGCVAVIRPPDCAKES